MPVAVICMRQELKYIGLIKEIPWIHIVLDNILGCGNPAAAIESDPGAVIPVISSVFRRFPG